MCVRDRGSVLFWFRRFSATIHRSNLGASVLTLTPPFTPAAEDEQKEQPEQPKAEVWETVDDQHGPFSLLWACNVSHMSKDLMAGRYVLVFDSQYI